MRVGDYVMTEDGEMGRIVDDSSKFGWFYVSLPSQCFSSIRSRSSLTLIDPAVADILTAVNLNEEK